MEKYYLWMILAFGESEPVLSDLLRRFGTAENVYSAFRDNVSMSGPEYVARAEDTDIAKAEKLYEDLTKKGITVLTPESENYPERLKKLADPPCALLAFGDTSLLGKKLVTVVGSRDVTPFTGNSIPHIIGSISKEYAIVGTLSEGCDQLTCLNALKYRVPFIEVLPCGFSRPYPAGSRSLRRFLTMNGGLLLTEYLPGTKANQGSFLRRSRILGGISRVTLVLQAGAKSGAVSTAEYSSAPLFLPPPDVFRSEYAGAVNAVRSGARLYLSPASIEKAYLRSVRAEQESNDAAIRKVNLTARDENRRKTSDPAKKAEKKASPPETAEKADTAVSGQIPYEFTTNEQEALYKLISASGEQISVEELLAKTGYTADVLAEALLDLEILGAVKVTGNRYSAL